MIPLSAFRLSPTDQPGSSRRTRWSTASYTTPGDTIESRLLRDQKIKNLPDLWIRTNGAIPPAISEDVFLKARRGLTLRWQHLDDDQLLLRLKTLLEKEGKLSQAIINNALGVPAINVYADRFGSLRNAYRRIGMNRRGILTG